MKNLLLGACLMITANAFASDDEEGGAGKPVYIEPGVLSITVKHNGKPIQITRNQDRSNKIVEFYQPTYRGKIQAMYPFEPHDVETIGELELIDYIKRASDGDKNILVIDSRTPAWVKRGTIPGTIAIPFTKFRDTEEAVEIMEEHFGVIPGEVLSFSDAKTLVMYCNGNWCPQSPAAIRKLIALGYPAAKLKYYRGGMQSWQALGLTVIIP